MLGDHGPTEPSPTLPQSDGPNRAVVVWFGWEQNLTAGCLSIRVRTRIHKNMPGNRRSNHRSSRRSNRRMLIPHRALSRQSNRLQFRDRSRNRRILHSLRDSLYSHRQRSGRRLRKILRCESRHLGSLHRGSHHRVQTPERAALRQVQPRNRQHLSLHIFHIVFSSITVRGNTRKWWVFQQFPRGTLWLWVPAYKRRGRKDRQVRAKF
jgi:hypothetical protein